MIKQQINEQIKELAKNEFTTDTGIIKKGLDTFYKYISKDIHEFLLENKVEECVDRVAKDLDMTEEQVLYLALDTYKAFILNITLAQRLRNIKVGEYVHDFNNMEIRKVYKEVSVHDILEQNRLNLIQEQESIIDNAIDSAVIKGREGRGCVFVKSAGNGAGAITYPGNYGPQVLAVANMTQDGTLKSNSSYGENMFIAAPGTYILSTVLENQTDYKTGTSMACPHVAGVAALILERNPRLSAVKVREIMARNAKKIGSYSYSKTKVYGTWNEHYGYGLVDAYNSVINTPRN